MTLGSSIEFERIETLAYLEEARIIPARIMIQSLSPATEAVYTLLCVFGLPLVALQIMTCAGGYPYEAAAAVLKLSLVQVHFAWLISWLVGNTLCLPADPSLNYSATEATS